MSQKFFITHSWKDIEFARRLFKDLTAHGVEGWMDDSVMRGGQRLAEEINRGLEGCDVYLPIMSPAALESLWCWEEINTAIALANRSGRERKLTIIPIIAVACEMPAVLFARFYLDFVKNYDDALKGLLNKGFGIELVPSVSASSLPKIQTSSRAITNPRDAKEMLLIPAGEFVMSTASYNKFVKEYPARK